MIEPLARMAEQWLIGAGISPDENPAHMRLMKRLVGWGLVAPIICLAILLPQLSPVSALAIGLISSGVFMLASGLLMQSGSVRSTGAFIQIYLTLALMLLIASNTVPSSAGSPPIYATLFILVFFEAHAILRHRNSVLFSLGCIVLGVITFSAIKALVPLNFATQASSSSLQIALSALVLLGYAVFRIVDYRSTTSNHTNEKAAEPEDQIKNDKVFENKDAPYHYPMFNLPGLVTRHEPDGKVVQVAGLDENLLSERSDSLLGHGLIGHIYVADRISFLSAIDMLRIGQTGHEETFRVEVLQNEQPQGQFKYLKSTFIGIYNSANELEEFYIQSFDCTQAILREQELEDLKSKAAESDVVKTKFLAGVSHELRTPLNSIMGFSDVLIHDVIAPLQDERLREYVQNIRQSGEHLLNVVNTMLDMSKIQNGHYDLRCEEFVMQDLIDRAQNMLEIQAENKNISLTFRCPKSFPEVTADTRALMQIIVNIVGNAIKFTDEGGVINLDCAIDKADLVISVADTGIGIPQDKLSEIGQPFMQVNSSLAREYEGTGLGLSLVKGLLELHDGSFDIQSELGKGTIVEVRIPQGVDGFKALSTPSITNRENQGSSDPENVKNVA